jgi:hypothetical protein
MAQFPVSDSSDIIDGLNYVLSGPGGLGQNFAGFSTYTPAYLTGNFRKPFTSGSIVNLTVAPISLGACEMLDGRTWKYMFASAQPSAPFVVGQPVTITGVTDPYYDGTYSPIGVTECTTTYVILRSDSTFALVPASSGGTASLESMNTWQSTDCDIRVTVTGAQDRVFVSGQLDQILNYTNTGNSNVNIYVRITRGAGFPNNDPVNPEFVFGDFITLVQKIYSITGVGASGSLPLIETVFANAIDTPVPGLYRYILEVSFVTAVPSATSITGGNTLVFPEAHGLSAGNTIVYTGTTGSGLTNGTTYYVIATGLTSTQCQVSLSSGGAAVALTNGTGLTLDFSQTIVWDSAEVKLRSITAQVVKP